MNRDPRYDVLFDPVRIGPVTAPNRFYQVPHCNGGGYRDPSAVAEMRRVKAEGGWGVVFTEQVEIHHSSEITPFIELRLWDDDDVPMLSRMADAIHEGGALAGIELAYPGVNGPNLYTREVPMAPTAMPIRTFTNDPVQAREMTRSDIRALRQWHIDAALRAKTAGFDLICLYGAHGFGVIQHFLSTATNHRSDEYGGSLENRARLMREIISDVKDAVGDTLAVTVRLSLHESVGELGFSNNELRDLIALHAELPDLWDLAHGSWEECSSTSRFNPEASQQSLVEGIKSLTTRPVVGVGRFTSPDMMVKQVKSGVMDLIGCARPSIADPYLPKKIDQGRVEDIRECIGCNICITGDMTMSLSRCTQNPTFMEEWRKGWHPERMNAKGTSSSVLVVGAGPAGLEAARALGERGYDVFLAERERELGGRVLRESSLPGLGAWIRVRDYRSYQIGQMSNVQVFPDNDLSADDVLEFDAEHVVFATGARWRSDGVARHHLVPIPISTGVPVFTPDDVMDGRRPSGRIVIYDDDHYYMASVCAELLAEDPQNRVTLVTPSAYISEWSLNTLEQQFVHQRLHRTGVELKTNQAVSAIRKDTVELECVFTAERSECEADAVILVTARQPADQLYREVVARCDGNVDTVLRSTTLIGDAEAPAPIAWATYAGHRYARELDNDNNTQELPFYRELAALGDKRGA